MNNKIEEFELRVNTADKVSEVFILDSQFHRIAKDVGETVTFLLKAGLYIVKVKSGNKTNEKSVALFQDTSLHFDPIRFSTPVPLEYTLETSEAKVQIASDCSKKNESDVQLGKGSKLFLFGSIPKNLQSSDWPEQNTDPAIGLTLRDFDDQILVDFGNPDVGIYSWKGEPWAACEVEINPGIYVLCVETNDNINYKQTVVASQGWQTQIFLQPRNYGIKGKDVKADLFNSSILLSRIEYGFNPKEMSNYNDGTNYRLIEQVSQALREKRNIISKELSQTLLSGKLDNPMLGLYAAHLMLQTSNSNFPDLKILVENLRRLLGKSHPDVEAIALKMKMATDHVFREFPMFANSWKCVLESSIENPNLIPLLMLSSFEN